MLESLLNWLYGYKLFRRTASIYDLKFKDLLLGAYKQQQTSKRLEPLFPENQYDLKVCWAEATANALAIYFGEPVSVKWLVAKAYQQGLCTRSGMATVEAGVKVARKWGIVFERDLPSYENESWDNFISVDFKKYDILASKFKIGSYYWLDTPQEVLQALDQGYGVVMGRDFVTPSPFTAPWVIGRTGTIVGPHSTLCSGYREALLDMLNSWGTDWGDKGFYYLSQGDVQADITKYGAVAITPIPYTPKDIKKKSLAEALKAIKKYLDNMLNAQSILYATAHALIGHNLAPQWQPTACAASVSEVIHRAFGEDIMYASTSDLYNYLLHSPKWEKIEGPEKFCVIISPTSLIPKGSPLQHGHTGIMGQYNSDDGTPFIMSNNSDTRVWDTHFTLKKWTDYFCVRGRLPVFYFRRLGV